MEMGSSYWKESAANNLPLLPCQVHIHSQQGSHCNRTTLLTSPWEAGGKIVNLFFKPSQEECQLAQCAFIRFCSCYFSHLLFLLPAIPRPILLFTSSTFSLLLFLIVFLPFALCLSVDMQLCQGTKINTACVFCSPDLREMEEAANGNKKDKGWQLFWFKWGVVCSLRSSHLWVTLQKHDRPHFLESEPFTSALDPLEFFMTELSIKCQQMPTPVPMLRYTYYSSVSEIIIRKRKKKTVCCSMQNSSMFIFFAFRIAANFPNPQQGDALLLVSLPPVDKSPITCLTRESWHPDT